MDERTKHLEMIQAVINRLVGNSSLAKGWTITIIAALFALAAKDADQNYIIVAYFPVAMFWILDAYYLNQERLFRALYDQVRQAENTDFSMDTTGLSTTAGSWASAAFSKTLLLFYGITLAVIVLVTFVLL